jgi:hypothetical protein
MMKADAWQRVATARWHIPVDVDRLYPIFEVI